MCCSLINGTQWGNMPVAGQGRKQDQNCKFINLSHFLRETDKNLNQGNEK